MLKIRLQGTTNDIKWFMKILNKDKRFVINNPSEPMDIKGSKKYKRVYTEVFRNEDDLKSYLEASEPRITRYSCESGMTFGYSNPKSKRKR